MMTMQDDTGFRLPLPAVLDLAAAEGFLDTMRHAATEADVKLDASGVEVLTFPCIQIILSALRTHSSMAIDNPSAAFVSAFRDLALDWTEGGQGAAHTAPEAAARPPAAAPPPMLDVSKSEINMPKRILTIDDSKTIRDMLNLTLSEAGYEVLQAVDGEDGIDMLAKERVDLVITDINMPKMDGYGVIRHMRDKAEHKCTPVLVLTTESETEKRNLARDAGATGWMVKPFDPERLIATINKVAP
jgi:two-component system chemotaxis response regulator CheY